MEPPRTPLRANWRTSRPKGLRSPPVTGRSPRERTVPGDFFCVKRRPAGPPGSVSPAADHAVLHRFRDGVGLGLRQLPVRDGLVEPRLKGCSLLSLLPAAELL